MSGSAPETPSADSRPEEDADADDGTTEEGAAATETAAEGESVGATEGDEVLSIPLPSPLGIPDDPLSMHALPSRYLLLEKLFNAVETVCSFYILRGETKVAFPDLKDGVGRLIGR